MINFTKNHVVELLGKDKRIDGRNLLDFRNISVEKGITSTAEGSARVKIGNTDVLVGVKLGVETPYPDTPNDGNLMVNAELLPLSSNEFESGPPGSEAIEIARVVDRGIREAKTIDTGKLCITAAEKVWGVIIDICTINDDGNLFDAAALATIAALQDARFPAFDGIAVDYRTKTDKTLPLTKIPVCVTVIKSGNKFLVDPNNEEETAIDARLTVWSTIQGDISAMQKGGSLPLSIDDINAMIGIAVDKSKELRKFL